MNSYHNSVVTDYDVSGSPIRIELNDRQWVNIYPSEFFEHLCQYKGEFGEVWIHSKETGHVTVATCQDCYDSDLDEFTSIPTSGSTYTYEQFFRAFSLELTDFFTNYLRSLVVVDDGEYGIEFQLHNQQ